MDYNEINNIDIDGNGNIVLQDINGQNITVNYNDTVKIEKLIEKINHTQTLSIKRQIEELISRFTSNNNINNLKLIETKRHSLSIVEFKFLNEGDNPIFIHEVDLSLLFLMYGPSRNLGFKEAYRYSIALRHSTQEIKPKSQLNSIEAYYELEMDIIKGSKLVASIKGDDKYLTNLKIPISQEIKPKETDRFYLSFSSNANPEPEYEAYAKFVFNKDQFIISDSFEIYL